METIGEEDVNIMLRDCAYADCGAFDQNLQGNFDLLHVNARSLCKNYDEMLQLLSCLKHDFSVIGVSETWFKTSTDINMFQIPGYSFVHICRAEKNGGGACLYIKDDLEFKFRFDLSGSNSGYEIVFVEITNLSKKIIVGCVYRAPSYDSVSFVENLEHQLQILSRENKEIYLMGDFNINLMNYDTDRSVKDFVDFMYSFGLFSLVNKPTRITEISATLIDTIFTNCIQNEFSSGIICSDISDHMPIFCVKKGSVVTSVKRDGQVMKRSINDERISRFKQHLAEISWQALPSLEGVNELYEHFLQIFLELYNLCFPLIEVSIKSKCKKPWVTRGLLKTINHKHKLYGSYVKRPTAENKKKYIDYKNVLVNTLRIAKQNYYNDLFHSVKGDIRKTWSHINELLGRSNRNSLPQEMDFNGVLLSSAKDKAESFNKYFIGLPMKISADIPQVPQSFQDYMKQCDDNASMFLKPTSKSEIIDIVSSLKPSKSSGSDDISPRIIKECIHIFIDPLCKIMNMSLSQGVVPDKLKVAKVVPVYKKSDRKNVINYRPIALLPIFSKILEKIIYKRLNEFLSKKNILIPQQCGFRKHFSTQMGVFNLLSNIIKAIDGDKYCLGIFLDLSKAFDTIDHGILLRKLEHYGIRGVALSWFQSYLFDRTPFVVVNGTNSQLASIKYGVPQGSVLGPLLFLIYINDIIHSSTLFSYSLFADDTSLLLADKKAEYLLLIANQEIQKLYAWYCCNKLLLNVQKTKCVIFRSKGKKLPDDITLLNVGGHEVALSENVQFLGLIMDEHLSWRNHLDAVCTKLSRSVGVIFRLKFIFPERVLITLYISIILPYLTYCNVAWGNTFKSYLDKLRVWQKKAIRLITNSYYRHPSSPLFLRLRMLPLLKWTCVVQLHIVYV